MSLKEKHFDWLFSNDRCTFVLFHTTGRITMSKGYAASEGDPKKRYDSPVAKWVWYGLVGNIILGIGSCGLIMAGKKKL